MDKPTRIPTPTMGRPRRQADMFQGPEHPAMIRVAELLAHEDFNHSLLLVGSSGGGKNCTMRRIAAKRCCQRVEPHAIDGCGVCGLCSRIFTGVGLVDNSYCEVSAADDEWRDRLGEVAEYVNGITNVHGGNPRPLPPVFAVDEVHLLAKRDQTWLANLIENHIACFLVATSEPDELILPLVSRCERIEITPPTEAAFCRAFAKLLAEHHIECDAIVPRLFYLAAAGSVRQAVQWASTLSEQHLKHWTEATVRVHLDLPAQRSSFII